MALAKYFSKDLLAINRLINTDQSAFEEILNRKIVTLAFDENAIRSYEGFCGLDLIIRLLVRFYPKIKLVDLSQKNNEKREELVDLAKKINGNIEIISDSEEEDVYIIAGYTESEIITLAPKFYFGSDNWISRYSVSGSQRFGESKNPFGSGMAACIVISNIFRSLFSDYIDYKVLDSELEFSMYSLGFGLSENPPLKEIKFKDVAIAGIGAIGNGTIWALSKIDNLQGDIALIDDETISLSNLQRYVLFAEEDIKKEKVLIAKEFLKQENMNIIPCKGTWKDYLNERKNWNIDCVAVGIDNENDRIGIQSSLPRIIFNSFTESGLIGITRHLDFVNDPCLACAYIPITIKKNRTTEIAENCNIPHRVDMVKDYYNYNEAVDKIIPGYQISLLQEISNARVITIDKLSQYIGMKIDEFYSDYICGGYFLKLPKTENEMSDVEAPLAFQSAMAGILLASELIRYHMDGVLRQEIRTDLYPLSPFNELNPYHRKLKKDITDRCLCKDNDFINRYREKWKI